MNKPERQHFIPRSYLNNFASGSNGKFFIRGKRRDSESIVTLSTKDVCVDKNLYTIPTGENSRSFDIEHFYADKVDSVFPEIYAIITDEQITSIDFDTRKKIINTALSLYFRTPKFLNEQNKLIEDIINEVVKNSESDTITVSFSGEEIIIDRSEANQLIKEQKERNRIQFLSQHLQSYEKFVRAKLLDNMAVYHITDDSEFITSDNPVLIRPFANPLDPNFNHEEHYNRPINPFDKNNMIHLPINNKTILTILPTTEDPLSNLFQRLKIGIVDVVMYNSDIERYCETWILGTQKAIQNHIADQKKYNDKSDSNIKLFEDYKQKVALISELSQLMIKYGVKSKEVLSKIIQLENIPHVASDENFQHIAKEIKNS